MVDLQPRATINNKAKHEVLTHRAGPTPLFPMEDNERCIQRPTQGTQSGQGHAVRLADAAGRDRESGPSSGRTTGDDDSASGAERIITVLRTDGSIVDRGDAAGSRHGTDERVRESPLLRKKRVRCGRFVSHSIATGGGGGCGVRTTRLRGDPRSKLLAETL